MTLTLTNPTLSGTVEASELNQNFSDIVTKFNGGITDADVSNTAGINVNKLSANRYEFYVTLKYLYDGATALSAASEGAILDAVPLPKGPNEGYKITGASWFCNDTGDNATTFDICWGYYDSGGTLQKTTTIVDEEVVTNASSNNDANSENCTIDSGNISWVNDEVMFLYLARGATAGSGTVDSTNDFLSVTLRISNVLVTG